MKVELILPLSIAVSVMAFGLLKVRVKDIGALETRLRYLDVRLRVTDDVLTEYQNGKKNLQLGMERENATHEELQKVLTDLKIEPLKAELDGCNGAKKTAADSLASMQGEINNIQAENEKEKTKWEAEIAALQEKLNTPSPICNYLKAGSTVKLCPEKKEEPKAEPPKPEEEKKEPPKPEEENKEPPKPEEEKKEPPKPEEAKPEEPKQEAPKQ